MKKHEEKAALNLLQEKLKEAQVIADLIAANQPEVEVSVKYVNRVFKTKKRISKAITLVHNMKVML